MRATRWPQPSGRSTAKPGCAATRQCFARACQGRRRIPRRLSPLPAGAHPIDDLTPEDGDAGARLAEAEALRRAREIELAEQRARAEAAEAQLAALRNTLSFGLGQALVEARSLRGLARLPARLVELWRVQRAKRKGTGPGAEEPAGSLVRFVHEARTRARSEGPDAARLWLRRRPGARRQRARALAEVALDRVASEPEQALEFGLEATRLARDEPRLRVLAEALHEAGFVRGPAALLERLAPSATTDALRAAIATELTALDAPSSPATRPASLPRARGDKVLIVAPSVGMPPEDLAACAAEAARRAAVEADLPTVLAIYPAAGEERAEPLHQPQADGSELVRLPAGAAASVGAALRPLAEQSRALYLVATGHALDDLVVRLARELGLALVIEWARIPSRALAPSGERRTAARAMLRTLAAHAHHLVARSAPVAALLAEESLAALHLAEPACGGAAPDPQVTADLRRELAIPADASVVGCVCPLADDPGLTALIEGLPNWPDDTILLVAGAGPARARLEARAAALRAVARVRFAGPLLAGDLLPTLDLCRVLILPRRDPRVIAADPIGAPHAAYALGLPLLATPEEAAWLPAAADPALLADPAAPDLSALPARRPPVGGRAGELAALFQALAGE